MTTKKAIELTITLGTGTFGEDVGDTVTLSGFRITADVSQAGGDSMGMCQVRVYGLRADVMNKLTTIGPVNVAIKAKNSILIAAGDAGGAMNTVFSGTIFDAWADYNNAPDVPFNIIAYAGLDAAVKPVNATSYKGSVDVATIMQEIATGDMGLTFENNGVSVQLVNPYFSGSSLNKIRAIASAAGVNWVIDRGALSIWTEDTARRGNTPIVSPDTGMVGYPSLSSKGMTVKMLFNPNIAIGRDIQVQSAIPMACGTWRVFSAAHNLSSATPDGPWFTIADVYNNG
jgi:hypothetical protein